MLLIITRADCPYCSAAKKNIEAILRKSGVDDALPMRFCAETEELAAEFDYYYTPAYFWDKEKLAEGAYTEEEVAEILRQALRRAEQEL